MFLDEEEIRRSLSRRALHLGEGAWPEIRRRLESRSPAPARVGLALAAILVVLVAAALWLRQPTTSRSGSKARPGFQVSRVESHGKPSAALVLQPDRNTLIVVVAD